MIEERETVQPPTLRLPPIAKIATLTSTQLFDSLQYLRSLYRPQVRGSRRRRRELYERNSPDDDGDTVHEVWLDAFECAYAIRWLTVLIADLNARQERSLSLTPVPSPIHADTGVHSPPLSTNPDLPTDTDTDTLIQQAASLLATCAGVAAAPKLHRRFSFESPSLMSMVNGICPDELVITRMVHVDLTDLPLDNRDYASVGAQTWGGACVLAEMIAERPGRFGLECVTDARWPSPASNSGLDMANGNNLPLSDRVSGHPLRILELGAGTGLVGLTVAKLLEVSLPPCKNSNPNPNHPLAVVVLTDFYPAALTNLRSNIAANFPTTILDENAPDRHPRAAITVLSHPLDWSSFASMTEMRLIPDVLSTPFDIIFGADIVYEAQHAIWIRDCLTSLLSYPDGSNGDPIFHLVIPLRSTHVLESSTVEEAFGSKDHDSEGSRRELTILSKESIFCETYEDRRSERSRANDDVEYIYYRIGWA